VGHWRERIAFCRWVQGEGRQVFVMDADGGGVRQLTGGAGQGQNWSPGWSPEGGRMCFVSDREGRSDVFVMRSDGSGQERLTAVPDADDEWPDWCPTGDRIAFSRGDQEAVEDLYVLEMGSGRERRLTSDETLDFFPSWAPDGTFIAFRKTLGDPSGLHVMPAEGGEAWFLAEGYYPDWSPCGDMLAYSCSGHIRVVPIDSEGHAAGEPRQLTSNASTYDRHPAWSPEGARIAFQSKQWDGNDHPWHVVRMGADGGDVRDLGEGEEPGWSAVPRDNGRGGDSGIEES